MNISTIDDALFYIEVYGPNYESSTSIDLSENPIVLSKNLQENGFVFYKLNVQYAGKFEIEASANDFLDLKIFTKDLNLINNDVIRDENGKTKLVTNLVSGVFYLRISYLNAAVYGNVTTSIKRIISNDFNCENAIVPDHNYIDECGSEVTINGGNYGGNTITQGFTRVLYYIIVY